MQKDVNANEENGNESAELCFCKYNRTVR